MTSPTHGMELALLTHLDALLRRGSVTAAASELGITQSAMSSALRRLRATLGDPLLVRHGNAMVLTARAAELRPIVEQAMSAVSRVFAEPREFAPARLQGVVTIATSDHVDNVLVPALGRLLAVEAPDLAVHVLAYGAHAFERLHDLTLDFVVAPQAALPEQLASRSLFSDPYVVAMRADHPCLDAPWTPSAYAELRHVLVSPGGGGHGAVDDALRPLDLGRRVVKIVPRFGSALAIVARSDEIATIPASFAHSFIGGPALAFRAPPVRIPPVRMSMAWSPRLSADLRHRWLRQAIVRATESLRRRR